MLLTFVCSFFAVVHSFLEKLKGVPWWSEDNVYSMFSLNHLNNLHPGVSNLLRNFFVS